MRAGEEEKPLWPRSSPCLKNIHAMDMLVLRFYVSFFLIRRSRPRVRGYRHSRLSEALYAWLGFQRAG